MQDLRTLDLSIGFYPPPTHTQKKEKVPLQKDQTNYSGEKKQHKRSVLYVFLSFP